MFLDMHVYHENHTLPTILERYDTNNVFIYKFTCLFLILFLQIDWLRFLQTAYEGITSSTEVLVTDRQYMSDLSKLLKDTPERYQH